MSLLTFQIIGGVLICGYWFGILCSLSSAPEGNFWVALQYVLGWPKPLWLYLNSEWLKVKAPATFPLRSGQELGLYD